MLALRAVNDVKAYTLVFSQSAEAFGVDLGEVSENVVTAVVWSDEAEALGVVKPFNGTGCHVLFPLENR